MKIVSTGYSKTNEYTSPEEWLKRIRFYTGLLEELAKHHEVYSIERINYQGEKRQNGVHYYFILLEKTVERFPLKMHRLIKELNPDVVLVNGFIFPLQIIQLRFVLGGKAKILVLHRAEKPFGGFKKWLQVFADRCIDAYLFSSAEFGAEWLKNGNIRGAKKIYEIIQSSSLFTPQDQTTARKKLSIDAEPVYLWVGRLEKNKDPLTVVKAFIKFLRLLPSAKLHMIYQTEELLSAITEMIATANVSSSFILIGKTDHQALEDWYSAADFFVSGSHYEGSGIAVVEAMSCGCIPLVTDIVSFRKMVESCGLLYPAGDAMALLEIFQQSLKLDRTIQRKKVLAKFKTDLSFTAIADKINHLLSGYDNDRG